MNKAELIAAVAEKTGLSKKDSEKAVNAAFDTITETLVSGEKVQMVGFGVFDVKERGVRIGRNPKTLEAIEIEILIQPHGLPPRCSRHDGKIPAIQLYRGNYFSI